jgi:hypothetical protein
MKRVIVLSAAAALVSGALLTGAQAAPITSAKASTGGIELVAAKKAAAKGPGKCGAHMFWDKKAHKCADARTKK